jgi:hypothetical protein
VGVNMLIFCLYIHLFATLFLLNRSFPGQIQFFCGNYNPISFVYLGLFAMQKDGKKGSHLNEDYKQSYTPEKD